MNRRALLVLTGAWVAGTGLVTAASAAPLSKPEGRVVLTVTGRIANRNDGEAAVFDLAMLEALPGRRSVIKTPWISGETTFEGPLGSALLDAVGAEGSVLHVAALNDYAADIPVEDFRSYPVILATRLDGKPLSVRDKGPIFVVYPFDLDPDLYNEVYFRRCVWQVKSIEVR